MTNDNIVGFYDREHILNYGLIDPTHDNRAMTFNTLPLSC